MFIKLQENTTTNNYDHGYKKDLHLNLPHISVPPFCNYKCRLQHEHWEPDFQHEHWQPDFEHEHWQPDFKPVQHAEQNAGDGYSGEFTGRFSGKIQFCCYPKTILHTDMFPLLPLVICHYPRRFCQQNLPFISWCCSTTSTTCQLNFTYLTFYTFLHYSSQHVSAVRFGRSGGDEQGWTWRSASRTWRTWSYEQDCHGQHRSVTDIWV